MKIYVGTEIDLKIYAVSWINKYIHGSKPIGYFTSHENAVAYMESIAKAEKENFEAFEIEELELNPEPLNI